MLKIASPFWNECMSWIRYQILTSAALRVWKSTCIPSSARPTAVLTQRHRHYGSHANLSGASRLKSLSTEFLREKVLQLQHKHRTEPLQTVKSRQLKDILVFMIVNVKLGMKCFLQIEIQCSREMIFNELQINWCKQFKKKF